MRSTERISLRARSIGALSLLWIALLNGYPIIFYDTGRYLQSAIDRFAAPVNRPLGYGWFIYLTSLNLSPWLTTITQAALAAAVIALLVEALGMSDGRRAYASAIAAAAALSSAPYFVGQIMPDFLSGLVPLALYMLIACDRRIGWAARTFLTVLVFVAVASHTSNVIVVPVTAIAGLLLMAWLARDRLPAEDRRGYLRGAALGIGAAALATLAICVSNLRTHGRLVISPGAHAFLLARLVADGPAADYLRSTCPGAGYRLCSEIAHLPRDSDAFLYGSGTLARAGGWLGSREESRAIIDATLTREPGRIFMNALAAGARQFVTIGLDPDVLGPLPEHEFAVRQIERLYPGDSAEFRASLQQRGKLYSRVTRAHSVVISSSLWLSLGVIGFIAIRSPRTAPLRAVLAGMLLAFLAANALVCGALSSVHERYQGRATWPAVVIAAVLLAASLQRRAVKREVRS